MAHRLDFGDDWNTTKKQHYVHKSCNPMHEIKITSNYKTIRHKYEGIPTKNHGILAITVTFLLSK